MALDMPNVPPQNVPVIIAQANQTQSGNVTTTRIIGVCSPAPNGDYNGQNMIDPVGEAGFYLRSYEHHQVQNVGTVTVLQQPLHGILRLVTEADRGTFFDSSAGPIDPADPGYLYLPENSYLGKDSATLLIDIGGFKVQVKYFFRAIGPGAILGNYGLNELCSKTGYHWKISSTIAPNGTGTLTAVEYLQNIASTDALAKEGKLHSTAFW